MATLSRRAGKKIKADTSTDRAAATIVVDIRTNVSEDDETHPGFRYATHVTQVSGAQFSYAFIGVPVETFGYEAAPQVALQESGPAGRAKLLCRARVKFLDPAFGNTVDLLSGYVVSYSHSINEDSVVAQVFDDRWVLGKITCFGRATYDPELKVQYLDAGAPLIFNRDGHPDCLDVGGSVRFAPTRRYGMGVTSEGLGRESEPAPGQATAIARSWRATDIMKYLKDMHDGSRPMTGVSYGNMDVSPWMDWPKSLGNDPYFDRVPRHFVAENLSLLAALQKLARYAGPFDIYCVPNGYYSRLALVRIDVHGYGRSLFTPQYQSSTIQQSLADPSMIQGGQVTESAVNYFHDVCICGDPPAVERFLHTDVYGGTPDTPSVLGLEPAWSSEDQAAFNTAVTLNGDTKDAFLKACDTFPLVYAAYRVKNGQKIWPDGSQWAKLGNSVRSRFLPYLLSSVSQGGTNPRDWQPLQVNFEWYDRDAEEWKGATRLDGLEISKDGDWFRFDALRREKLYTLYHDGYTGSSMLPNDVRLSVAVRHWVRTTSLQNGDPNKTSYRMEGNGGAKFTYLATSEPQDYIHYERAGSQPFGDNIEQPWKSTNFPDKVGAGSELFTDATRLARHALHRLEDVKRIDYNGSLVLQTWNPGIKPGDMVAIEGGGIIPKASVRSVTYDATTQQQVVELVKADNETIYDVPVGGQYLSPVKTPPGASSDPKDTTAKRDDPKFDQAEYEGQVAKADSRSSTYETSMASRMANGTPSGAPAPRPAVAGGSHGMDLVGMVHDQQKALQKSRGQIKNEDQMRREDQERVKRMAEFMAKTPEQRAREAKEQRLDQMDAARRRWAKGGTDEEE